MGKSGLRLRGTSFRLSLNTAHTSPIQIMSDLHLEGSFRCAGGDVLPGYDVFDCNPSSPVLALLGDIGLVVQDGLFAFLQRQLSKYEKIFFVMGNHEYYRTNQVSQLSRLTRLSIIELIAHQDAAKARINLFADQMRQQRSLDNSKGEFIFLDRTRYDLTDDITILGCTLWSHIPPTASDALRCRLNDFKRISQWSVESHNSAHFTDANWLDSECSKIKAEEPDRRVVIFTHYAPVIHGTSAPEHQSSLTNSAFATDMTARSCWGHPVSLWAFGHTHFNCDFVQDSVRVVSNQRGYEGIEASRSRFSDNFVLYV
jgi:predicted phosphodiesterase